MGRRALFEKYISGLKGKKEEKLSSSEVRWITFSGSREDFTESSLMSFLGVHGLDVPALCKSIHEQISHYKAAKNFYVKVELLDDKTFRVFVVLPDSLLSKTSRIDSLGELCQYSVLRKRTEVKAYITFMGHLRMVLNKARV